MRNVCGASSARAIDARGWYQTENAPPSSSDATKDRIFIEASSVRGGYARCANPVPAAVAEQSENLDRDTPRQECRNEEDAGRGTQRRVGKGGAQRKVRAQQRRHGRRPPRRRSSRSAA